MKRNITSTRHSLHHPSTATAILIGAGVGRHCISYGVKSLFKIGAETLLGVQANELRSAGVQDIIGVFGFEAARVVKPCRDLKIRFIENYYWDYSESGMVRSIDYGLKASVAERVIIIHADILFKAISIQDLHDNSSILLDKAGNLDKTKPGVVTVPPMSAVNFSYGLPDKWCQIVMLEGRELELAYKFCEREENWRLTTFEMLNAIIDAGGRFTYAVNNAPICEIDTHQDTLETKNDKLKHWIGH